MQTAVGRGGSSSGRKCLQLFFLFLIFIVVFINIFSSYLSRAHDFQGDHLTYAG